MKLSKSLALAVKSGGKRDWAWVKGLAYDRLASGIAPQFFASDRSEPIVRVTTILNEDLSIDRTIVSFHNDAIRYAEKAQAAS